MFFFDFEMQKYKKRTNQQDRNGFFKTF